MAGNLVVFYAFAAVAVVTTLLVIERFMTQKFFSEPDPETVSQLSTE